MKNINITKVMENSRESSLCLDLLKIDSNLRFKNYEKCEKKTTQWENQ